MRQSLQVTKALAAPAFTLALPKVFDIKPDYEVALPAGRTAKVYSAQLWDARMSNNNDHHWVSGWRVVIVRKSGAVDRNFSGRYGTESGSGNFFDPLDVTLFLNKVMHELTPKKKTTVEETDLDD